jgi:Zn finger protein HypA/HybF involved in hydrogenase expression
MQGRGKSKPVKKDIFVQYGTMFKLEDRVKPAIVFDANPRQLECLNCQLLLEWRIYTIAPEKFDNECPECGVKARDFWKGKLHRELDDA